MQFYGIMIVFLCFIGRIFGGSLPEGKLEAELLAPYIPLVMEELSKEFSLQNTSRTQRCTREYGYRFFELEKGNKEFTPIPEFFQKLGDEICKGLGHPPQTFMNVILSIYDEGFHLEPHMDIYEKMPFSNRDYFFGENVYGIVIEPDSSGHLYFVTTEEALPPLGLDPIYSLEEVVGSIYCLSGPFRRFPYFHGVSRVAKQRITITFRTVCFSG